MSGIRKDASAQVCVLLCETVAFPKGTPKGGETGMVCHWYVTMEGNTKTAHLPSEIFRPNAAGGSIQLDWCAFLVLDAGAKADVRLTVADLAGNHLGAHFGTTNHLANSDQFDIRTLKLENVDGVVATMTVHAAAQVRWTSASAPRREPGSCEFLIAEDAQAAHIWKFLFPNRAPPTKSTRSELKPIKEEEVSPAKAEAAGEEEGEGEEEDVEEEEQEEDPLVDEVPAHGEAKNKDEKETGARKATEDEARVERKKREEEAERHAREAADREAKEKEAREREEAERRAEREAKELEAKRKAKEREVREREEAEKAEQEAREREAREREERQAKERDTRDLEAKHAGKGAKDAPEKKRSSSSHKDLVSTRSPLHGRVSSYLRKTSEADAKRRSFSGVARAKPELRRSRAQELPTRLGRREVGSPLRVGEKRASLAERQADRRWIEDSDSEDLHFSSGSSPEHVHQPAFTLHRPPSTASPERRPGAAAPSGARLAQDRWSLRRREAARRPVVYTPGDRWDSTPDSTLGLELFPCEKDDVEPVKKDTKDKDSQVSSSQQQLIQLLQQQQQQLSEQLRLQRELQQHWRLASSPWRNSLGMSSRASPRPLRRAQSQGSEARRSTAELAVEAGPRKAQQMTSSATVSRGSTTGAPRTGARWSSSSLVSDGGPKVGGQPVAAAARPSLHSHVPCHRLYRVITRGLGIRAGPNVNAPRTGDVLKRGDVFEASVVARGADGRTYLKLAGWRGWAFDDSAVDPTDPSVEALMEEEAVELLASSNGGAWPERNSKPDPFCPRQEPQLRGDGWSTPSGTPETEMFVPPLESRRKGEYEAFHPSISHEFREDCRLRGVGAKCGNWELWGGALLIDC
ncbi:unnamed protein product [Durusdinium trenchii]|uniref:Uncharacterized protein n=1 Tax=Durusdinium trenchii TaxID=1381693 RepID=A0ABP0QDJ4_9DINO